jgi:hypothetical protein
MFRVVTELDHLAAVGAELRRPVGGSQTFKTTVKEEEAGRTLSW